MENGKATSLIDLQRLRAFVAVAEEAHITRAAERLGMAQPPLSRMMRALEDDLGVRLLHRLPRGVEPTAAGLALLVEARAVLERAGGLRAAVQAVARGEQGRLAVGFTASAAMHPFVSAALRAFRAAVPQVRLALDEAGSVELAEALTQGRLDAAFIRSPLGQTRGLLMDPLLEEPMVAALPVQHPLAGPASRPIALSSLAGETFVLYRRLTGPGLYDSIIAACRAAGFSPIIGQEAPRLPATLSLVAAGLGISIVPASMHRTVPDGVVYRSLSDCPGLCAPLHLAVRAVASPPAQRLRALVRDMAAAQTLPLSTR